VVIAGETNLMGFAELSNVDRLRRLFEAFGEKRDILHLLDQSLHAQGVQIFIGHESGYHILDDCTVVTAPYAARPRNGRRAGRHRPDPHGLRAGDPDRGHHGRLLGSALNSAASHHSPPTHPGCVLAARR
jgi:heat-inducible transcriptional repressor